ncbi:SirB2 family protein [Xanthomonadaceae bacterium JHOS43]|nr:SirB2 family protein [Xanthomonadaceae bacterium JHOS43]
MIEFYLQIKLAHIGLVLASGLLFAARGLLVLLGQGWAMAAPLRWLSYAIDTSLLTAALMLLVALQLNPFTTAWLATKLVLLVIYVVLGSLALKRARGRGVRLSFYLAALMVFGFMYSVARAHHPLGAFLYI